MTRNSYNFSQMMETLKADYQAAKPSKYRRTRSGLHGNADAHYASDWEFCQIREYARDMDRNDAIIGQLLDRAVDNVIRNGFIIEPQTGDRKLDEELWARWNDWANDKNQCDVAGEHTFRQQERLAYRHMMVDGDVFALRLDDEGALQMVEAHRCRTPRTQRNVVHGVLLDPGTRKREQYWLTRDEISPFVRILNAGQMDKFDARDEDKNPLVYHVYKPSRYSQTRGITWFKSILDVAGAFDDLNFAKLLQSQLVSMIGLAIENAGGAQIGPREQQTQIDGSIRTNEQLSPAFLWRLKNGEKLQGFSPNVPNAEYFPFARLLMSMISLQFGVPLWLALLDSNESSFTSQRSTLDQAKVGFICNQQSMKDQWHVPAYLWKVRQWLAQPTAAGGLGEVARTLAAKVGQSVFAHKWNAPAWRYQQPEIEAGADKVRKDNLLASPRQILAEQGRDYDDVVDETVDDNGSAIEKAMERAAKINAAGDGTDKVSWRDVLYGGNSGIKPSVPGPGADEAQKEFERKAYLGFQKDGTVADVMANSVKLVGLTAKVGLPVQEDYEEPWLPVQGDNPTQRPLVSGEVVKDNQGSIVGGAMLPAATPPAPPAPAAPAGGGAAKPAPAAAPAPAK